MKSLLLTAAIIAILATSGFLFSRPGGSTGSGNQAPTTISDQIAFRDEAVLVAQVLNQINAMRQLTAMGNPDASVTSTLAGNDELKERFNDVVQKRHAAGIDEAAINQLKTRITWAEFERQDAELRAGRAQ